MHASISVKRIGRRALHSHDAEAVRVDPVIRLPTAQPNAGGRARMEINRVIRPINSAISGRRIREKRENAGVFSRARR